jgi:hypothetical protein
LIATPIDNSPARCSRVMGGVARIAAQREIFRSTTCAHAAGWETMPKKTSSHSARLVTEPDINAAKSLGHFDEGIALVIGDFWWLSRHKFGRTERRRSFMP